jgi:carboxyl-terminal processing protease
MKAAALTVVLGLSVGLVAIGYIPMVRGAGADSSLVEAALRVLDQYYFKPVDPVALLNSAVAGLRKATNLASDVLPDIPAGVPEAQGVSTFRQRFARAAQARKMPGTDLAYQATQEMLAGLHDGDTFYMDPAGFAEKKKKDAGAAVWAGIGVFMRSERDSAGVEWIFIEDVYPGSPAQAAGLKRFDRIVEVDGKSLRNVAVTDASQLLRGVPGSTASLIIQRGSARLTLSVVRAPIRLLPRAQVVRPGVAYLRIYYFSEGTGDQVRSALRSLASQGPVRAVVLDLRGNAGGYLSEIQSVAGVFLPSQTVFAQVIRHAGTSPMVATGESLFPTAPVAVLSDKSTVAGELLLGFRAAHRATMIGEKSAGIGGSGADFPLPEGGMHVTVEMVVGPHSEPIQGVGVAPDKEVALTEADMERGVDTQLDAALAALGR